MTKNTSAIAAFGKSKMINKSNENEQYLESDVTNSTEIQKSAAKQETKKYSTVPWYPPTTELKRQLQIIALDEETSMSKLLTEGLRSVFEKRGKNIENYLS